MSTTTKTFTVTDARYLGSKIAADLHQMQRFYGRPTDLEINQYIDEFVILLKDSYLESVDYGFQNNGSWVIAVSYEVGSFNSMDQNPGRIVPGKDITGATWWTYLRKSSKFYNLSLEDRTKIEASLPFQRVGATDPQNSSIATYDKTYGSGEVEIKRKTYNQ